VIFTWLVKLGEPCCPAEADSSGELVEGVLVLVTVRTYADALVVLGPQPASVVPKPGILSNKISSGRSDAFVPWTELALVITECDVID
jgi:hypothetical protein